MTASRSLYLFLLTFPLLLGCGAAQEAERARAEAERAHAEAARLKAEAEHARAEAAKNKAELDRLTAEIKQRHADIDRQLKELMDRQRQHTETTGQPANAGGKEPGPMATNDPEKARAEETRRRAKIVSDLRLLGLAMHNHNDAFNHLPAVGYKLMPGMPPLHTRHTHWRVQLLPFLEEENLYKGIQAGKFPGEKKPLEYWTNADLRKQCPSIYSAGKEARDPTLTHYRVFVGNGALFERDKVNAIHRIPDGTSNTIMIVEAAEPVPWTEDRELEYDPKKPLPRLGQFPDGFYALLADGSVRFIPRDTDEKLIRALITAAGAETIGKLPGRPASPGKP